MSSTVYIYVNSIAWYGPRYICKCKRHENVSYECITNGLFGTLATERICSAVLLNCTKARIEPLFELNRTAASIGVRALSDLGGGVLFARKNYIVPKCFIVEIRFLLPQNVPPNIRLQSLISFKLHK